MLISQSSELKTYYISQVTDIIFLYICFSIYFFSTSKKQPIHPTTRVESIFFFRNVKKTASTSAGAVSAPDWNHGELSGPRWMGCLRVQYITNFYQPKPGTTYVDGKQVSEKRKTWENTLLHMWNPGWLMTGSWYMVYHISPLGSIIPYWDVHCT